ncbi:MAG: hypothetical protein J6M92_08170 [Oribacterium sp.]|nr:hypothetical protein [Oribacterium sp.]
MMVNNIFLATKAASPSAIVKMIRSALEWWSTFVGKVMAIITEPITSVWNGALWRTITTVYKALLPVGYALCVMSFLISLFKVCGDMVEHRRVEHLFNSLVRYIVTYSVLANGLEIVKQVIMIFQGCIFYVTNATGLSLNINYTLPESVEDAILDTTFAEDIIYFVLALLFFLVVLVFGFMLLLTVMGRFMRLGIVVSLAPFGFAWFSGELTKDMGKAHMKTILSTAMEGLVLAVAIVLSAAFVNNLGVTYDDTGGGTRVKVYNVRWNSSPRTRSVNGTETQGIEVRAEVVNAYTSGGYSADYSSYPSNRFRNAIVETNVPDSSMIRYESVSYYPDNVGNSYVFFIPIPENMTNNSFAIDAARNAAERVVEELMDFSTAESEMSVINSFMGDTSSIGYVIRWMLVVCFNIILFVGIVKGIDSLTNSMIKG